MKTASPSWATSRRSFFPDSFNAEVRPADLVGAITGEAGVEGRRIGAIQMGDTSSLVEVPESAAQQDRG